ncbi:DEAD/DEAH box helicase [Azospirillum sp. sgz302134]
MTLALAQPRRAPFELRPYQADGRAEILTHIEARRNILYCLPTGGGKTPVVASVADEIAGCGGRVGIFTHREELLRQASRALRKLDLEHGLVRPGRLLFRDRIAVCSINTLVAREKPYRPWLDSLDLAIVDEAQHSLAPTWSGLFNRLRATLFGVSATPWLRDGTGLGRHFSVAVHGPSYAELVAAGYLSPLEVFCPPLHVDLDALSVTAGDYNVEELARVMDVPEVTNAAVHLYAAMTASEPCLVFCVSVAHAEAVARQFTLAGYAAKAVDGTMSDAARDRALTALADGRLQVVVSCDLLNEGVDCPGAKVGIMLRPTRSSALYLQQAGRLTRLFEGKTHGTLIDMAGNVARHGLPDEPREWSLAGCPATARRPGGPLRRCRSCSRVVRPTDFPEACPSCGTVWPSRAQNAAHGDEPSSTAPRWSRSIGGMPDEHIRHARYITLMRAVRSQADVERIAAVRGYRDAWVRRQVRNLNLSQT